MRGARNRTIPVEDNANDVVKLKLRAFEKAAMTLRSNSGRVSYRAFAHEKRKWLIR